MSNVAPVLSLHRSRTALRLLALLLACLTVGFSPAVAGAQSIVPGPQTKQEQKAAEEAADAESSPSTGSGAGLEYGLLAIGLLVLAGAAIFIMRDSSDAVGDRQRAAPTRPLDTDAVGRGAPRTMFSGDAEPGGKAGKRKKRAVGKRQRNARKANRPR